MRNIKEILKNLQIKDNIFFCFFAVLVFLSVILLPKYLASASPRSSEGFYATWKLLNFQEKQQFMAGYIYGWQDAANVTDIAIDYVKDNPQKAIESLEQIKRLYNNADLKSMDLVKSVDQFFSNPDNHTASLSSAVSAARNR